MPEPKQQPAGGKGQPGTGAQAGLAIDGDDTVCLNCGESHDLAKVKGCIKCLRCGFKFDCNGW